MEGHPCKTTLESKSKTFSSNIPDWRHNVLENGSLKHWLGFDFKAPDRIDQKTTDGKASLWSSTHEQLNSLWNRNILITTLVAVVFEISL